MEKIELSEHKQIFKKVLNEEEYLELENLIEQGFGTGQPVNTGSEKLKRAVQALPQYHDELKEIKELKQELKTCSLIEPKFIDYIPRMQRAGGYILGEVFASLFGFLMGGVLVGAMVEDTSEALAAIIIMATMSTGMGLIANDVCQLIRYENSRGEKNYYYYHPALLPVAAARCAAARMRNHKESRTRKQRKIIKKEYEIAKNLKKECCYNLKKTPYLDYKEKQEQEKAKNTINTEGLVARAEKRDRDDQERLIFYKKAIRLRKEQSLDPKDVVEKAITFLIGKHEKQEPKKRAETQENTETTLHRSQDYNKAFQIIKDHDPKRALEYKLKQVKNLPKENYRKRTRLDCLLEGIIYAKEKGIGHKKVAEPLKEYMKLVMKEFILPEKEQRDYYTIRIGRRIRIRRTPRQKIRAKIKALGLTKIEDYIQNEEIVKEVLREEVIETGLSQRWRQTLREPEKYKLFAYKCKLECGNQELVGELEEEREKLEPREYLELLKGLEATLVQKIGADMENVVGNDKTIINLAKAIGVYSTEAEEKIKKQITRMLRE